MSLATHTAVVRAALDAAGANPYDVGKVPGTFNNPGSLPQRYTEFAVDYRYGGNDRMVAQSGPIGYRVRARAVADSEANAQLLRDRQRVALRYAYLVIEGKSTTPVQPEDPQPIDPDEGMFSGLATFIYTH